MTDITVNPAGLSAAAKTAVAGDTLRLAPGAYPAMRLRSLQKGAVTITSEDPASPARFTDGLTLDDPASVRFVGVDIDFSSATKGSANAVTVYRGQGLAFIGCRFNGALRSDGARWGRGLVLNSVKGLTVEGSTFNRLYRGIVVGGCEDVLICDNDLTELGSDGIDVGQSARVQILRNLLSDFAPRPGDHPDGIQIMTAATGEASEDILLADNLIACGTGPRIQGIFFRAENKAVRHRRVQILRNLLVNVGWQGINAGFIDELVLEGNRLPFQPPADGSDPKYSWIKTTDANGRIADNRVMRLIDIAGADAGGNVEIPAATDEEISAMVAAWRVEFRAPATPDEPKPELPARDEIHDLIRQSTVVKQEALKTKGRVSFDWKTPAEADAFLAAVQALRSAA